MDTIDKTEKIFKNLRLFFLSVILVLAFAGGIAENYSLMNTFSTTSAYALDVKRGKTESGADAWFDPQSKTYYTLNADGGHVPYSGKVTVDDGTSFNVSDGKADSSDPATAGMPASGGSSKFDNQVFNTVVDIFREGSSRYEIVFGYAQTMLLTLITLDFALSVVMGLLDDGTNYVALMIRKTLKYGFWIWVVANWVNGENFCNLILQSFATVGGAVGGIDNPLDQLIKPSWYVDFGLTQGSAIWQTLKITHPIDFILGCCCALIVIVAFFIIAFQLTVAMVEFYLSSTLSLIMLPLGVFEHTAQWGRAPFSLVIGHGCKVMVIGAVAGIIKNFIESEAMKTVFNSSMSNGIGGLDFTYMCSFAGICMVFAMLALNLPAIASGLVSGSPSLSAGSLNAARATMGSVAGGAFGAASGVAGAAAMSWGAAKGGAMLAKANGESGAMGALKGLTRAAAAPMASELGAKFGEGKSKGSTEGPSNWYGPYNYRGNEYAKKNDDHSHHSGY